MRFISSACSLVNAERNWEELLMRGFRTEFLQDNSDRPAVYPVGPPWSTRFWLYADLQKPSQIRCLTRGRGLHRVVRPRQFPMCATYASASSILAQQKATN